MIRLTLLAVASVWLATGTNACAQGVLVHSDLSNAHYDRVDTLRAVKHLFMKRSKATRGILQAGSSTLALATLEKTNLFISGIEGQDKSDYEIRQQKANGDLLIGGLATSYGLFRTSRFGLQQYQRVLEAYEQGMPLPAYLKRKLKTKYFRLQPL